MFFAAVSTSRCSKKHTDCTETDGKSFSEFCPHRAKTLPNQLIFTSCKVRHVSNRTQLLPTVYPSQWELSTKKQTDHPAAPPTTQLWKGKWSALTQQRQQEVIFPVKRLFLCCTQPPTGDDKWKYVRAKQHEEDDVSNSFLQEFLNGNWSHYN